MTSAANQIELLVQLRGSPIASTSHKDGYLRRSKEEIKAFSEENARYVDACREKIKQSLPRHAAVEALQNLNILVVSVPSSSDLNQIKRRIEDVCEEVENITEDFELKAARQRETAADIRIRR